MISKLEEGLVKESMLDRINVQLAYARTTSFYHDYPESLDTLEMLAALPIIDEQDIIQSANRMLAVSQSDVEKVTSLYTSGTMQLPKRIFFAQADLDRTLGFFVCGMREAIESGDRVLILMPGENSLSLVRYIAKAIERIGAKAFHCPLKTTYAKQMEIARSNQVNKAVAAPFPLLSLLRYAKSAGNPLRITQAILSSDYLTPSVEHGLSELGCEGFNHYGMTEFGFGGAVECSCHQGMHLRTNDLHFEIIDPYTKRVLPDGQVGEIVVTSLTQGAMPLLRYNTGDLGYQNTDRCDCGSDIPRISGVHRKAQDRSEFFDELLLGNTKIIDLLVRHSVAGYCCLLKVSESIDDGDLQTRIQSASIEEQVRFDIKKAQGDDYPYTCIKRKIYTD
jgi:phenylacetate-CoA ligase